MSTTYSVPRNVPETAVDDDNIRRQSEAKVGDDRLHVGVAHSRRKVETNEIVRVLVLANLAEVLAVCHFTLLHQVVAEKHILTLKR